MIMPDSFIPRAEEIGLIGEITEYVLEHGMRWLVDIDPTSRYSLSINLSARSLGEPRFADHVSDVCRKHAIEPQRIVLELTETAATEDPVAALDLMTRLRVKGFQVSIDDFGTGYSSMAQLAHLPFSEIKVDKTFVIAAGVSEEARSIIKSTVDLGHTLGMQVTAEGVESQDNLDYLCATGCDYAQGYFIARPMSGDVVAAWIAGRQSRDQ
jgi:EAL domain-containing protein (putative c-di-GMP-specific phosphodiesterase class I)